MIDNMNNLPNFILVVVCKYSKLDEGVLEALKEYFSGMPRIQYTSPSLYDINNTYYILPYTNTFRAIVNNINKMVTIEVIDTFGYTVYERCRYNYNSYIKTKDREVFNYRYFPLTINIDLKHLETLKLFTEN